MTIKGRPIIKKHKSPEITSEGVPRSASFLGSGEKTPTATANSSIPQGMDTTSGCVGESPHLIMPKWYKPIARRRLRLQIVKKISEQYAKPVQLIDKSYFTPTDKEIREYVSLIKSLKLKDIIELDRIQHFPLPLDIVDRIRSLDKKKHAAVTIINDNNTLDTFVVHIYDRIFFHNEMCYIIRGEFGLQDPEISMKHFYYYVGNPWPINLMAKNKLPQGNPDASILYDTIKFESLRALGNINLEKSVNILIIVILVNVIISIITALICARGFKLI